MRIEALRQEVAVAGSSSLLLSRAREGSVGRKGSGYNVARICWTCPAHARKEGERWPATFCKG
jgi:hypothetical protein